MSLHESGGRPSSHSAWSDRHSDPEGARDTAVLLDQAEATGRGIAGRLQCVWLLIPSLVALSVLALLTTTAHRRVFALAGAALHGAIGLSEQVGSGGYPLFSHVAEEVQAKIHEENVHAALMAGPGLWTNLWKKPLHVHDEPAHPKKTLQASGRQVHPKEWVVGVPFGAEWIKLVGEPGYLPVSWGHTQYLKQTPMAYVALKVGSPSCREFGLEPVARRAVCEAAGVALNRSNILYRELELSDSDSTMNGGTVEMRCYSAGNDVMWAVLKSEVESGRFRLVCANQSQPTWTTTTPATSSRRTTVPPSTSAHPSTTMMAPAAAAKCDICTPRKRQVPTVVIPFYERDLCKVLVLAKSISVMDKQHVLGDVNFMWISHRPKEEFQPQIDEIQAAAGETHRTWLFDFHWLVGKHSGWRVQQILKLKVASKIYSDYYLVLDAKNAIISPIGPLTFFDECNRAVVWGKKAAYWHGLHEEWYRNSAGFLGGVDPPHDDEVWPASISPQIFHRLSVIGLLASMGEDKDPDKGLCNGNLCHYIEQGATEFTLYNLWARRKSRNDCIHALKETGPDFDPAESLWRGDDLDKWADWNLRNTRRVADQVSGVINGTTIMFGAQAGAIDGMDASHHYEELHSMSKIFQAQGLFDPAKSWQALAACIVGPPGTS